jgi:hypothetical protein
VQSGRTGAAMVLTMNWRSPVGVNSQKRFRLKSASVEGTAWVRLEGKRGNLVLWCELAKKRFDGTAEHAALGALHSLIPQLPELEGDYAGLRAPSAPKAWSEATDSVEPFLERLGLAGRLEDRTISFSNQGNPSKLLRRAAVVFLALDPRVRELVHEAEWDRARNEAIELFGDSADVLLQLMDNERGKARLSDLLGTNIVAERNLRLEEDVIATLRKLTPERLVHFGVGSGAVFKRIVDTVPLKEAYGVESSLVRLERARRKTMDRAKVFHGSIIEPPAQINGASVALFVESFPRGDDERLRQAETILFEQMQFDWVLSAERIEVGQLREWVSKIEERSDYRGRCWQVENAGAVALFRRQKDRKTLEVAPHGPFTISTELFPKIEMQECQWASTLDAFSHQTIDPRWLMYLPSGLCSIQNQRPDGLIEHPQAALDYYDNEHVSHVVAELKHMGSRAIAVVCRDEEAGRKRFGPSGGGCIYTRNGRPFFEDPSEVLSELRQGLSRAKVWEKLETDWVCLDGELLPWTLKAEGLLEDAHGEILQSGVGANRELLWALQQMDVDVGVVRERLERYERYGKVLQKYRVEGAEPMRFAPFHVIATEGRSFFSRSHLWHMTMLKELVNDAGGMFLETPFRVVPRGNKRAEERLISWWLRLSEEGAEGLVIKPMRFIQDGRRGLAQPGIKCRGREHLRLVYGPAYDLPDNIVKLLDRESLVNRRNKHRRILKQFALSVEGVERFIKREPLARVQECVRGVLSLETREQ